MTTTVARSALSTPMARFLVFRFACTFALLTSSFALHAQLPRDNEAWKLRCNLLQANNAAIAAGHAPVPLVQGTRGLPGLQYMTFGFDRREAAQHNVACVFFYMGAIAEGAGNGGKPDLAKARAHAEVALAEFQQVHGQKVPISERMKRFDAKLGQTRASDISAEQATAILNAASTMPVTLQPPH